MTIASRGAGGSTLMHVLAGTLTPLSSEVAIGDLRKCDQGACWQVHFILIGELWI